MRELRPGGARARAGLIGALLLGALAVAQLPGTSAALIVALAGLGLAGVLALALPRALAGLRRHPWLIVSVGLAVLLLAWITVGLVEVGGTWKPAQILPGGSLVPPYDIFDSAVPQWPWRLGDVTLLPLALALLCSAGGFVLVCDAVRVLSGLGRPPRSRWRSLTALPSRRGRVTVRVIPGIGLIACGAVLGIGVLDTGTEGSLGNGTHPVLQAVGSFAVVAVAGLLIASPIAVGLTQRVKLDKDRDARERERQRFAAHLHDSVLQTLALIQRQAADPEVVMRLARRQEHALRAWLAGESDLNSDTVCAAIREMLAEVEDEHGVKAELTAIGDAKLDARTEELVAAAREAVRNCARHAAGAPVNVFVDVGSGGTELFVRDSGPGFSFDSVPRERRGLRDSVIGRMSSIGGVATVDSSPGEGTEIALKLPGRGAVR